MKLCNIALLMIVGLSLFFPGAIGVTSAQEAAAELPAAGPATIKGRVFDEETGETMPYTNIFIAGTNIGTMAFTDGFYIIRGLQPGTYTIKASYVSYGMGSETITVGPGSVVNHDFSLEVQAIMLDPLEIAAERALVEVDRTGSAHFISSSEMEAMPLDQIVDMIAQQPGVTIQDNEIHIRGGRADDTMFVVDGMSVSDPLGGGGYGQAIDPSIINEIEVLTGGFNAEYGQAVSGVVNISTKEGSNRVEGKISLKRDYLFKPIPKNDYRGWRDRAVFTESNNIDIIKASVSGPDPFTSGLRSLGINLPGENFMLGSLSLDTRDGYLPISSRQKRLSSPVYTQEFWAPRQQNSWNGFLKWTWNITPRHKININSSRQIGISQGFRLPGEGYPLGLRDRLDGALVFTNENILNQIYYRQVLSDTDWFEMTIGRNFSRMHANVNGNDDYTTYAEFEGSSSVDGFSTGTADRWHDHYTEAYTFKGAYSFMGAELNKFKTGLDLSFTEIQLLDLKGRLANPDAGKLADKEDRFLAHPVTGAVYFQDTLDYRGLIINAGVRADFFAPGREVESVVAEPDEYLFISQELADEYYDDTTEILGRRWKFRVSPRLGLSFPVTERDKFFFNYGHFSQWPRFLYVYPQLFAKLANSVQLLGNPNLEPKVTVEYETGIQHEFDGLWSMGLTFFNRDVYGYAKSQKMGQVVINAEDTPDPTDTQPISISPIRYFNGDSARSLGVELSIVKRTTKWLSGSANVELQRSTGTASKADATYLQAIYNTGFEESTDIGGLLRQPLVWDKPWTCSFNLDFSVFDKDRPELFGWRMPSNWSINLLARAESGQRYTPYYWNEITNQREVGSLNSSIGSYKSTVNIRINKYWKVGKHSKFTIYLEGRNLFNSKNYRRVNPYTGEAYQLGDYNPEWVAKANSDLEVPRYSTNSEEYSDDVIDPSHTENPRIIMWGASYSW